MITDSFDEKSQPLVSLREIYGEQKHSVGICIVTFSRVIYESILSTYVCKKIAEINSCNGNIPIYSFLYKERELAFYLSPVGATVASQCIEEANWLCGATKFISFGSAGSLAYEKTSHRFVIPTEAYRDEGMSYHYAPPSDYIQIKNARFVKKIFSELGVPLVEGKIWTTDSILRETAGQAEKRRSEGCIAVEMEIAGMQSVCDFYGFDLYTFVVTGDVLFENGYSVGTLTDANHNVDKFRLALEIADRL